MDRVVNTSPTNEGSAAFQGDVAVQLTKVFDMVAVWRDRTHLPSPDPDLRSSLGADDVATRPWQMSHAVVGALVSATDHLDTLRTLILDAHRLHARAPYTLLRAALENAAIAVWLLASANRNDRILRRLRLQWADEHDRVQALNIMQAGRDDRLADTRAELQQIARDRGLTNDQVSAVAARPFSWGSMVETAGDAAATTSGRDARWSWAVCSGIAHAKSWAALSILERTEHRVTDDDVVHLEFRASKTAVVAIAQVAALMTAEGWRLFDLRCQPHHL